MAKKSTILIIIRPENYKEIQPGLSVTMDGAYFETGIAFLLKGDMPVEQKPRTMFSDVIFET